MLSNTLLTAAIKNGATNEEIYELVTQTSHTIWCAKP